MQRWNNAGWVTVPFIPLLPDACHVYTKTFRSALQDFIRYLTVDGKKIEDQCPWPAVSNIILL